MSATMKRRLILSAIVVVNIGLVCWLWLPARAPEGVPPDLIMTTGHLTETPDFALIHMVYSGLRVKVMDNPDNIPRWRSLPEAARHALVMTWVEENFGGFSNLLRRRQSAPFLFEADDLVAAYEKLGIAELAQTAKDAGRQAGEPAGAIAPPPDEFKELDGRFAAQRNQLKVAEAVRAYIRAHVEEIVNARL